MRLLQPCRLVRARRTSSLTALHGCSASAPRPASRLDDVDALLSRTSWLLPDPHSAAQRLSGTLLCLRDDLLHHPGTLALSGNKARKLDALLPQLLASGVRDVVTCGGLHSAHAAAVATGCAASGMRAHLLLRGEAPAVLTGHALTASLHAASLRFVTRDEYAQRETMLRSAALQLNATVIPEGGAGVAALLGLLRAVHAWSRSVLPADQVTTLVVDSGTGCTAYGLALGCALLSLPWRVLAVPVGGSRADAEARNARLGADWNAAHPLLSVPPADLPLEWTPAGRRFGECSRADVEACARLSQESGIAVDPIWTLRAYEAARERAEATGEATAWVHTGGAAGALDGAAQRWPGHFSGL